MLRFFHLTSHTWKLIVEIFSFKTPNLYRLWWRFGEDLMARAVCEGTGTYLWRGVRGI